EGGPGRVNRLAATGGLTLAPGVEDKHSNDVNRPADRHWHDEPDHRDPRAPALVALPLVIADIRRAEEPEKAHQSWGDVEEQPEYLGAQPGGRIGVAIRSAHDAGHDRGAQREDNR